MTDNTLHEAHEKPRMFEPGTIVSMLDIVAGSIATCDSCKRWQKTTGVSDTGIRANLSLYGWTFHDGRDLCPICSKEAQS